MNPPLHLRALIVDDEPVARRALIRLLAAHPDVTVVGEAATLATATTLLAAGGYDVVFLDIQLRGGSGFDLVAHVAPAARIIFITAHDQYALRAFAVNALDYILKPVDPPRLAASLSRLTTPASEDATPSLPLRSDDTLYLKTAHTTGRFVRLPAIAAVLASENYSEVWLASGERIYTRRSMKTWEDTLPAANFARVHRGAFVNLSHLQQIDRTADLPPELRVAGLAEPIPVSRRLWPELRGRLKA